MNQTIHFCDLKLKLVKLCNIFHGGHLKNIISLHAIRNSHEASMFSIFGATVLKWPWNPKQNTRVAVQHYKAESNVSDIVRVALSHSQILKGEGGVLTSDPCSYIDCSSALRGQWCEWWVVFILTTDTSLLLCYITVKSVTQQFPDYQCHIHANNSLIAVSHKLLIKTSTQSDAFSHVISRWTTSCLFSDKEKPCKNS